MNKTQVDWLSFRSKMGPEDLADLMESVFPSEYGFDVGQTGRGWNGYEKSYDLLLLGKRVGQIATGGEHQCGWSQVTITGEGIPHIPNAPETLTKAVEDSRGQLKRVDIALTTMDGSVTADKVLAAYRSGGFDCSARRPTCLTMRPEDPTEGTTVSIGKRNQPKYFRAYEKGFQMAKQLNYELDHFDGVPLADIFRLELEIKAKPVDFPSDILINRDSFFAGAYPFLATVVDADPAAFSLTPQRQAQLTLDASLECIRRQWGNTLFTALAAHEGDFFAVWNKIVGRQHCKALLERGAMFASV